MDERDSDKDRFGWEEEDDIVIISRGWQTTPAKKDEDEVPISLRKDWKQDKPSE